MRTTLFNIVMLMIGVLVLVFVGLSVVMAVTAVNWAWNPDFPEQTLLRTALAWVVNLTVLIGLAIVADER